jgi:hypothetical protein
VREDASKVFFAICDGGVWKETTTGGFDFTTLLSQVEPGGTAARSGNTVTGTSTKFLYTVNVGDYFYYDSDGASAGGLVASVDTDTQITLSAYAGSATSGAYTVWRKLNDGRTTVAVAGDRLWFADGTGPLHWYGDDGDGTDVFREAGLMRPAARPTVALAAGGALSAGNYFWQVAFEDARGNIGPAITTLTGTALANEKCTLGTMPAGPVWATKYRVYRTLVGGALGYHITKDITTKLKSISTVTLTLDDEAQSLTTDAHIGRYVTFGLTGTEYRITDNDGTTITLATSAAAETATDYISISGGYDIDAITSLVDVSPDTDLDDDHLAPGEVLNTSRSYNEPPPSGLQYITSFRGDGRLCALEAGTGSRVWFSGRPQVASKTGQAEFFGEGEFDYWPHFHDAGPRTGVGVMGFVEIGRMLHAIRKRSIWRLNDMPTSVDHWHWRPRQYGIGTESPDTIVVREGIAWFLGLDSEQIDIIRFDGNFARGVLRPEMRKVLDEIHTLDEATGEIFEGRIHVSHCYAEVTDTLSGAPSKDNGTSTVTLTTGGLTLDAHINQYLTTGSTAYLITGNTANTLTVSGDASGESSGAACYIADRDATVNNRTLRLDIFARPITADIQPWGCGVFFARTDKTLLCGAPSSVGDVYKVYGTAADLGSDTERKLVTGDLLTGKTEHEATLVHLHLEVLIE